MVLPLAVIAVVLAADFLLVLRRGHDEWRDGESLSRTTGWLIASLYFGIVALFVYAILCSPGRSTCRWFSLRSSGAC